MHCQRHPTVDYVFLLCPAGEPALVSAAASLLTCILVHNSAALSRLYLTGVFLFGLAYCGSNLTELAALFKAAHLVQAFRWGCRGRWGSVIVTELGLWPW